MANKQSAAELLEDYAKKRPFPEGLPELYEPCSYILSLGGKRMRPLLTLWGYGLFRDDMEKALPAAWAVELFHNFSLIHDDIMDAAPLRRGRPAVHVKWNTTTGILSGDVMLIYAYRSLAEVEDTAKIPALLDTFNRVATEVCEGQQMDINFESRPDVDISEYIRMIELKTSVLLGGALELGAICAGASPDDVKRLYHFGRLAGISFQIQDDYLDTYGDPDRFGKQVGGDILQNKKTLPVLQTLASAPEADRRELLRWMSTGAENAEEKISAVRAIFDRNQIPERIAAEQRNYERRAFEYLDAVNVPENRKSALRTAVQALFVRQH